MTDDRRDHLLSLDQGGLDEEVYEAFARQAAGLNNEGAEAQLAFLLDDSGVDEAHALFDQPCDEATALASRAWLWLGSDKVPPYMVIRGWSQVAVRDGTACFVWAHGNMVQGLVDEFRRVE